MYICSMKRNYTLSLDNVVVERTRENVSNLSDHIEKLLIEEQDTQQIEPTPITLLDSFESEGNNKTSMLSEEYNKKRTELNTKVQKDYNKALDERNHQKADKIKQEYNTSFHLYLHRIVVLQCRFFSFLFLLSHLIFLMQIQGLLHVWYIDTKLHQNFGIHKNNQFPSESAKGNTIPFSLITYTYPLYTLPLNSFPSRLSIQSFNFISIHSPILLNKLLYNLLNLLCIR